MHRVALGASIALALVDILDGQAILARWQGTSHSTTLVSWQSTSWINGCLGPLAS